MGAEHVPHFEGAFETNSSLVLLTRYVDGKDLATVINYGQPMSREDLRTICSGVAKGLKECHKRCIIHRDLKPQNIVVDLATMQPTIIDFGMVLDLKKEAEFQKCGTLAYMAPEVFRCGKFSIPYGIKSDLFSLGVIAHIMMSGENPLRGCQSQIYDRTAKVTWNSGALVEKWGHGGLDMVAGLLQESPARRWDSGKLLEC